MDYVHCDVKRSRTVLTRRRGKRQHGSAGHFSRPALRDIERPVHRADEGDPALEAEKIAGAARASGALLEAGRPHCLGRGFSGIKSDRMGGMV